MSDGDRAADMLTRTELTAFCARLDEEISDLRTTVKALEKRLDRDDAIRAKLRAIAGQRGDLDSAAAK